jgi:hypothetical protein
MEEAGISFKLAKDVDYGLVDKIPSYVKRPGIAKPVPDSKPVKAVLCKKSTKITISWGPKLKARKGKDYILYYLDTPKDKWVVRKDIFEKTYIVPFGTTKEEDIFVKNPDVEYGFFPVNRKMTIKTLEGEVPAKVGMICMVGVVGELWPMEKEKFDKKYIVKVKPKIKWVDIQVKKLNE